MYGEGHEVASRPPPPYHTSVLIHSCQPCRRIFVNGSQTKVGKKKRGRVYSQVVTDLLTIDVVFES